MKWMQTKVRQHFLIIRMGCQYCRIYYGVVEKFNAILKPKNRIKIIDVTDEMLYGIKSNKITDFVDWRVTPTLYLDGIIVEGTLSKWDIIGRLKCYFESIGEKTKQIFVEDGIHG